LDGAGISYVSVCSSRATLKAKMPLLRVGEPEGKVSVGEREWDLFVIELEVEAGADGFDVWKARGGAGIFLRGRSGIDVRGVEEDAFEVPLPCCGVDKVDAGFREADGGELDAAKPERTDPEGGTDRVGADDRLRAEGGVFVDNEVVQREAGKREEIQ
jgi:hypothetical protein